MSTPTAIRAPSEIPDWLPQWPAAEAVRALFPEGVRNLGYRAIVRAGRRELKWGPKGLLALVDNQRASWTLVGNAWTRACSCGYPNDRCPHLYAAACMLTEVVKRNGWTTADGPAPEPVPAQPTPTPHAPERRAAKPPPPSRDRTPASCALEVEADFHHEPGKVTIRFFRSQGEFRAVLKLQSLHNLAMAARKGRAAEWREDDREFLRWLGQHLEGNEAVRQNLTVLKLDRSRFDMWLERWESVRHRFIERSSRAALTPDGQTAADLVIELRDLGEWIGIAAVVVTPDGTRRDLPEVFRQLASGEDRAVIDEALVDFRPPFSPALIREVFARKVPRMRREHICEHLPNLLEGRLDLLEGPCVRREPCDRVAVRLEARGDGADVLLRARAEQVTIRPDAAGVAGKLKEDGALFAVTLYDTPAVRDVRRILRLQGVTPDKNDWFRVPGSPQRLAELRAAWQQLPVPPVETRCEPELEGLLGRTIEPQPEIRLHEESNFVDLTVSWRCGDSTISDGALAAAMERGSGIARTSDGRWLAIDPKRAAALRAELAAQGLNPDAELRLFRDAAGGILRRVADATPLVYPKACTSLAERLAAAPEPRPARFPNGLRASLRHYQRDGFDFLADRAAHGIGTVLADDMGLGKTLQVLALLLAHKEDGVRGRSLVVCPASVVGVWLEQATMFCPTLNVAAYTGPPERRAASLDRDGVDVLVTNYALARQDATQLAARSFLFVVLDEAQHIKNPESQVAGAVKSLRAERTVALTGTPVENRALDLWSIMDFVNPGFLGSREHFTARYEAPGNRGKLAERIAPVILRRTKEQVAPELPPKTEETLHIELNPEQRRLYDLALLEARKTLRRKGPIEILAALTRLRQLCCHPLLLPGSDPTVESAKTEALLDMLGPLAERGSSALVFSQFTRMLDLLRPRIEAAGIRTMTITGKTPVAQRSALVREFNESSESIVFLLSLKAAGTGLTLTRADYVFLFDPWWNPAVERQAIDRTHRIGQDKPVFAYRLAAADTVEDKVISLQHEKAELFREVVEGETTSSFLRRLSAADIEGLLA